MIYVQGDNGIPVVSAIMKGLTFRGIVVGSVKQYGLAAFLFLLYWYVAGRFEDMNRLIATREIRPVVDKIFTFEQTIDAYSYLESQKHVGKVVIKIAWGVVMGYKGQRGILVWRETSTHVLMCNRAILLVYTNFLHRWLRFIWTLEVDVSLDFGE